MIGGDYIERNYEAAAVDGRVVQIAFQASPKATVNFLRLMLKRLTHTGSTLRARSIPDKAAIARAVEENVLPLIAAGKVKPVIDSTFPLAQAAAAHARMETSAHIGKIVLVVCCRALGASASGSASLSSGLPLRSPCCRWRSAGAHRCWQVIGRWRCSR